MNTTEKIVEAIKKAEIIEDCINGRLSIAIAYCNLEDEITSVIGQEDLTALTEKHRAEMEKLDIKIERFKEFVHHKIGCDKAVAAFGFAHKRPDARNPDQVECSCGLDQLLTTNLKEERK